MGDNNEGRITLNIYNKPPQFEDDNNENNENKNENMNQTESNLIASTDTIPDDNNNTVNNINTINPTMNDNSPSAPRPTTSSLPTESQVMGIHDNNNNKSNYKSKISKKMNNNNQIYSKPKTNTTLKYPELSAVKQPNNIQNNIQNIYQQPPPMINPMPYIPVYSPQYIQTPIMVQPMPITRPKTVIIREQVKESNNNVFKISRLRQLFSSDYLKYTILFWILGSFSGFIFYGIHTKKY